MSAQVKNPQFLPYSYETLGKYFSHELRISPKFHKEWAKIVDFLLGHWDFKIAFLIKLQLYTQKYAVLSVTIHLLSFISNAVLERPVNNSQNFDGVAYIA